MPVMLVGWDGRFPVGPDVQIDRESSERLHAAVSSEALVIVLGRSVLSRVRPDVAGLILDGYGGVVFAEASEAPDDEVTESWRAARVASFSAAEWLPIEAARVLARRPHRRLSLYEWLGPAAADLPTRVMVSLREFPRLDLLVVDEWAERLGLSSRGLRRMLEAHLPWGPGTLLRDYRLRSARQLTATGLSMAEVAPAVGYSCASALCRALNSFDPLTDGPLLDPLVATGCLAEN